MAQITLSHVGKVYPDGTEAVRELDLEIGDGELVVLVGPSGCGKTTALRMVAGLEEITRGTITIGSRVINDVDPRERDVAMVFQNYALYPHMTVLENLAFPLKLAGLPRSEREEKARRVARALGLEHQLDRKPRRLSGGQQQRVAMGRAIVREPQAFLMDEPLSNLDAKLRVEMRAEIHTLQKQIGVTTIYVTHDQVEAMTIGDRVALLRRGELLQFAEPQELYDRPANLFVAGFVGSPAMNLIEAEVRRTERGCRLAVGDREVALDESELGGATSPLGTDERRAVVAGIRPESLEDAALVADAPVERRLRGVATLREALGSDALVHFNVEGSHGLARHVRELAHDVEDPAQVQELDREERQITFVGRFKPHSRVALGEPIEVAIHPGAVMLFDPRTGERISRSSAPA
jgi:multiple sugar transport system ATP-binding protein